MQLFPIFFFFLTTMSLSTCPLLGTVSLGGENLKTSNRWCQPRPSSFCRGRECGRRRHTCGRRGSCSVAWTRVQISVVLEKGTAHRATRPDTDTRTPRLHTHAANGRPNGDKRQVLLCFCFLLCQDARLGRNYPSKWKPEEASEKRNDSQLLRSSVECWVPWVSPLPGRELVYLCASVRSCEHVCACILPCSTL